MKEIIIKYIVKILKGKTSFSSQETTEKQEYIQCIQKQKIK